MHILMLGDHNLFREGLKLLLQELQPDLTIHAAETMDAALELAKANAYELVLLDLNLTDSSGLDTLGLIKEKLNGAKVIILSTEQDPLIIYQAIDDGAMGFITKCTTHKELISAIELILAGGIFLPREVTSVHFREYG